MQQKRGAWAVGSDGRSTAELLRDLGSQVTAQRRLEVDQFKTIIAWADANVVEDLEGAATIRDSYLDTGIPIAGPGAPLVSEFGLTELVATLGRSLDGGRDHVGKVIECGWRLPRIRDAVYAGKVPVWKALRVADLTRTLSAEAARFVDRNLAFALPTCTWVQVERLVTEAIDRFDPEAAEERRQEEQDHRHFRIETTPTTDGLTTVSGLLDSADAIDLDHAISRRATVLGQLGCEDSLDVRRSIAAGELARQDLSLDLQVADLQTGEITRTVPGRKVELYVHLTDTALTSLSGGSGCSRVGRLANTQTPISVEQIRQWCGQAGNTLIVRPVIDLADHVPVDSYEIPDRLKLGVGCATTPAAPPTATAAPRPATSTTPIPTHRTGRPAPATSCPCVDDITGPRPSATGATPSSTPAPTCGPPRTGSTGSSTTPAPGSSTHPHPSTRIPARPTGPNPDRHALNPAPRAGPQARPGVSRRSLARPPRPPTGSRDGR